MTRFEKSAAAVALVVLLAIVSVLIGLQFRAPTVPPLADLLPSPRVPGAFDQTDKVFANNMAVGHRDFDVRLQGRADQNGNLHGNFHNNFFADVQRIELEVTTERWQRSYTTYLSVRDGATTQFSFYVADPHIKIESFTVKGVYGYR